MSTIRLADLVGSRVVDADGSSLGRVVDLVIDPEQRYAVRELVVGRRGWFERLDMRHLIPKRGTLDRAGRIPWSDVEEISGSVIHLRSSQSQPPAS